MAIIESNKNQKEKEVEKRQPYESPSIVHAGVISTRAGSPITLTGDGEDNAVDPADLFGNGN